MENKSDLSLIDKTECGLELPYKLNEERKEYIFVSKDKLKKFLEETAGTAKFKKIVSNHDQDLAQIAKEDPLFILKMQTMFCLVEENAKELWEMLLNELPLQKFTQESLKNKLDNIGTRYYDIVLKNKYNNDLSVSFGLQLETSQKINRLWSLFKK